MVLFILSRNNVLALSHSNQPLYKEVPCRLAISLGTSSKVPSAPVARRIPGLIAGNAVS